jgi:hypothetical protein
MGLSTNQVEKEKKQIAKSIFFYQQQDTEINGIIIYFCQPFINGGVKCT